MPERPRPGRARDARRRRDALRRRGPRRQRARARRLAGAHWSTTGSLGSSICASTVSSPPTRPSNFPSCSFTCRSSPSPAPRTGTRSQSLRVTLRTTSRSDWSTSSVWSGFGRDRRSLTAVAHAGQGGVVVHCQAGKDRTGLVSALLRSQASPARTWAPTMPSPRRTFALVGAMGRRRGRGRAAASTAARRCSAEAMVGVLTELEDATARCGTTHAQAARASPTWTRSSRPCAGDPPDVIAVFGPTASGKTAVAEALADRLDTEVVSADAMQVYRGLPVLTNQSERPARLVGMWPLAHEASVGEVENVWLMRRSTSSSRHTVSPSWPEGRGSTCVLRSRTSSCRPEGARAMGGTATRPAGSAAGGP